MTTAPDTPAVPEHIEVNGKLIRFRWAQMTLWKVIAGFAGACFVAGLYFALLQVNWHVWIGPVHFEIFNLKPWWDGLFSAKSWPLYRHGLRDLGEPAAATVGIKSLLAPPAWWGVRIRTWQLLASPVLLAVVAIGLIAGGIWLINFGLPGAWHWTFGAYRLGGPAWLADSSWEQLLLGLCVIGPVLHRIWAPAGATLQGYQVDAAVDRALLTGREPRWVSLPVVPPVLRERFSWDLASQQRKQRGKIVHPSQLHVQPGRSTRVLVTTLVVLGVVFTLLGIIAKFWIASGHSIPFLTG